MYLVKRTRNRMEKEREVRRERDRKCTGIKKTALHLCVFFSHL